MGADDARDKRRVLDDAAAFRARGDLARAAAVLEERLRRAPDVELLTAGGPTRTPVSCWTATGTRHVCWPPSCAISTRTTTVRR